MSRPPFVELAERVVERWNQHFTAERPFAEQLEDWYGIDYPLQSDLPGQRAKDQGIVSPETGFAECLANARQYAAPHLLQLAEALDHSDAVGLRTHLTESHEVIVVDIGCAAGILSLLVDRAGFAHYVGVDTNNWMRLLTKVVFETTLNDMALADGIAVSPTSHSYGSFVERDQYSVSTTRRGGTTVRTVRTDRPGFGILESIDSHDGWTNFVKKVSINHNLRVPRARHITVLVVMNHLLFQLHDVTRTVTNALAKCLDLGKIEGVNPFLLSIEPGTLYKPDRLGTHGFDQLLTTQLLRITRYKVPGLSSYLIGKSKGEAAVRLVTF